MVVILSLFCQRAAAGSSDTTKRTFYGIELNQFISGSGFPTGTELMLSVTDGNRSFHTGFYFCSETRRITGIIAHHEISLTPRHSHRNIQPFVFYNGIARLTRMKQDEIKATGTIVSGIYKSFEHHIGIGVRTSFSGKVFIQAALGYGVYFGSIMKPVELNGMNELAGSNGFSPLAKLGIGLVL